MEHIALKECSRCKEPKPVSGFGARKENKDGLRGVCKACESAAYKKYYLSNAEKMKEKSASYRQRNPDKIRSQHADWKARNKEKVNADHAAWRAANPEKVKKWAANRYERNSEVYKKRSSERYYANKDAALKQSREWAAKNREKSRDIKRRWMERNRDKVRESSRAWFAANPEKRQAYVRERQAAQRRAVPSWLTPDDRQAIDSIYAESVRLTAETGVKHHVDHIVPLKGDGVSGLHVPWNLQVIPADENIRKSNKLVAA